MSSTIHPAGRPVRMSRRRFGRFAATGLAVPALLAISAPVALQAPIVSTQPGEVPSTGASRPGPMGLDPGPVRHNRGVRPVAIEVDAAGINAEIEYINIVDGVMQNPTGPWVVSWYQETAELGQTGNIVFAGHVDYWDVGPAVFFNIRNLKENDKILVTGEDQKLYTYLVQWQQTVETAGLSTDEINELVGPTDDESITLITCGGEFDYSTGEYLSRTVVRGLRGDD